MRFITVDLEDWFQVNNLRNVVDWDKEEVRVVANTRKVLKLLKDVKATFFVLGWIADKFPYLIGEVKDKGHEIACHGYSHKLVYEMAKKEFSSDIDKALKALKDACGVKAIGYRAPSFSIVKKSMWALDILNEKGFKYDSSMVNVKHPDYGISGIPNKPFKIKGLIEYPITTTFGLPVGGGYFRIYPYFFSKFLVSKNPNTVFYIHPWEFDPLQPRKKLSFLKSFRHYYGLSKTENKFKKLLKDFRFSKLNR